MAWPQGVRGQDGVWDFFKISEKMGGGGIVVNLQRSRGHGQ